MNNSYDELIEHDYERWVKLESEVVTISGTKFVEVSVTDSGRGIDSSIQDKIMEPFFTTKLQRRGTGLGLSINQGITKRHGGNFFLDTTSSNTRFVIRLRLSAT